MVEPLSNAVIFIDTANVTFNDNPLTQDTYCPCTREFICPHPGNCHCSEKTRNAMWMMALRSENVII